MAAELQLGDDGGISLSVNERNELYNPYPNPFNPMATIAFDLAESVYVSLVVYDITGREVVTLVDGFKTTGSHEVKFDAGDLVSGVYFARLTVDGGGSMVRKLVLMK